MSNIEPNDLRDEAIEITTFVPRDIELIDPEWHGPRETLRPVRRPRKWLPIFLFVATCGSTFFVGMLIGNLGPNAPMAGLLLNGLQYSVAVMSILLAHEMGHYLVARYHRVPASLPYFIPMPIPPLGTMGAVIVQGRGVADRRQMFDIAIAGPLAGLVLAIPIACFGMAETHKSVMEPGNGGYVLGDPLVMQWMKEHFHGPVAKNEDVAITPLLMAGWVGIFVTALNLIPIGQLDGGHLLYCLIGRRAHRVAIGMLLFAIAWMVYTGNVGYMLIVVLLIVFGPRHPPTANDYVSLGRARIVAGWLTLAFIIIGFTPVPITFLGPP
jgi:membrane-associated protease RseP (regulator of RpoE activity)